MDDPVHHYREGDIVPKDARRVVVDGSVVELGWGVFWAYAELEWVELQEGVEAIGSKAFYCCPNLEHVIWPSSLIIVSLEAFSKCDRLSVLNLPEGLQKIEMSAFHDCLQLSQVTIPSSVVEIGSGAFRECNSLVTVTLTGGTVLVKWNAFFDCSRLVRIAIPSVAIIVDVGGFARAEIVTTGEIQSDGPSRLILTSPYLASMKSTDVTCVVDTINRIIGEGTGQLNFQREQLVHRIRARFLRLLSAHRETVASILERALWRSGTDLPMEARGIIMSFIDDIQGG